MRKRSLNGFRHRNCNKSEIKRVIPLTQLARHIPGSCAGTKRTIVFYKPSSSTVIDVRTVLFLLSRIGQTGSSFAFKINLINSSCRLALDEF